MVQGGSEISTRLIAVAGVFLLVLGGAFAHAFMARSGEAAAPAPVATVVVATPEATIVPTQTPTATPAAMPMAPTLAVAGEPDEAARAASWRATREATLRLQTRLRAEDQARKARLRQDTGDERCVEGLRMRRVANGWVQDGAC